MDKPIAYFLFGIQFLGAVSIFLAIAFYVVFSGGLDLMGYELPGLSETCIILPVVFPLTLIIYSNYSKLKDHIIVYLLLIAIVILNLVLVIQALRVLGALVSWFV